MSIVDQPNFMTEFTFITGQGLFTNNDCETLNSVMKRDDTFKLMSKFYK